MLNRMGSCLLVAFAAIAVLYSCASAQTEKKTLYAVLVDNTKSMERQFTQGRVLGKGVIKRIHDRGSISVFSFEAQPRPSRQTLARSIGWTNNEVALTSYIDGLSPVGGYAALLESIEKMADELGAAAKTNGGVVGAKVLILITDGVVRFYGKEGQPNGDMFQEDIDQYRRTRDKVIKKVKASGVIVYAIGLTADLKADAPYPLDSQRERAESLLSKITKETGGRVVFARAGKIDPDNLVKELLVQ